MSFEVSNVIWPRMTFDDIDTWLVIYNQFVGADSKYDISFALSNVPKAKDSCKFRTNNGRNRLTAHGRRVLAWPWPRGNCILLLDIP